MIGPLAPCCAQTITDNGAITAPTFLNFVINKIGSEQGRSLFVIVTNRCIDVRRIGVNNLFTLDINMGHSYLFLLNSIISYCLISYNTIVTQMDIDAL